MSARRLMLAIPLVAAMAVTGFSPPAHAMSMALVKAPSSVASDEAREALIEGETRLSSGDLDAAASSVDRAIELAPAWYAPYLTRDRIAEARARAAGIDPAAAAPAAGVDYIAGKALLEQGKAALDKAAELAPEERKQRIRELAESRGADVAKVDALSKVPVPAPVAPAPVGDSTPASPPEPEIPPEQLERNKKITAEQRKANRLIVAGAVSAGVIGPVLLISPLAFVIANADDNPRARTVGIATGIIGGIGLTAGLTLVVVGMVKKKNAPKKFALERLQVTPGGLGVAF